jgi:hypothetical protein
MAKSAGRELCPHDLEFISESVLRSNFDHKGALDDAVIAGHAEAPLRAGLVRPPWQ